MEETLAVTFDESDTGEVTDINGHEVKVSLKKN